MEQEYEKMREENDAVLKEKHHWEAIQNRLQQQLLEQADGYREECKAHMKTKDQLEAVRSQLSELQKEVHSLKFVKDELDEQKAKSQRDAMELMNMSAKLALL